MRKIYKYLINFEREQKYDAFQFGSCLAPLIDQIKINYKSSERSQQRLLTESPKPSDSLSDRLSVLRDINQSDMRVQDKKFLNKNSSPLYKLTLAKANSSSKEIKLFQKSNSH